MNKVKHNYIDNEVLLRQSAQELAEIAEVLGPERFIFFSRADQLRSPDLPRLKWKPDLLMSLGELSFVAHQAHQQRVVNGETSKISEKQAIKDIEAELEARRSQRIAGALADAARMIEQLQSFIDQHTPTEKQGEYDD